MRASRTGEGRRRLCHGAWPRRSILMAHETDLEEPAARPRRPLGLDLGRVLLRGDVVLVRGVLLLLLLLPLVLPGGGGGALLRRGGGGLRLLGPGEELRSFLVLFVLVLDRWDLDLLKSPHQPPEAWDKLLPASRSSFSLPRPITPSDLPTMHPALSG